MSGAAGKREVTIAECLALPDDSRFELIDGELVEKASPTFEHGLAQAATVAAVRSARGWWIATEVDIVLDGRGYRPDTVTKLRRYHQAGVPHYWIVDQVDRTLTVHRHLPEGYLVALRATSGERVRAEPFDAVEVQIGILVGEDPEE